MALLKEIADVQTGPFGSQLHKEDYVQVGTPIVTVEHLGNRVFTEQNLPMVSDEDKERLSKYVLQQGDTVFSRVGSVDRCSYVDAEHDGWMFSGRCLRVRPNKLVDPEYLYYFFTTEDTKQLIRSIAVGATMPSINTKILSEVEVPLPAMDVQKRIAGVLSAIDEKVENNNKINRNLSEQANAIFAQYYEQADDIAHFSDRIKVLGGGTPKTGEESYWNGGIPFFTPKDVGTPYTFSTEKYISENGLNHCNSRLYPVNTTFVTARGTVGKVALAGVPMAMNQSCYALVSDTIDPVLVYFYTLETVKFLKHKASGAVFDAIVTRDFDTETLNFMTQEASETFLSIIKPMMVQIHKNTVENVSLQGVKDSLLPKLMSGELDVSKLEI